MDINNFDRVVHVGLQPNGNVVLEMNGKAVTFATLGAALGALTKALNPSEFDLGKSATRIVTFEGPVTDSEVQIMQAVGNMQASIESPNVTRLAHLRG